MMYFFFLKNFVWCFVFGIVIVLVLVVIVGCSGGYVEIVGLLLLLVSVVFVLVKQVS